MNYDIFNEFPIIVTSRLVLRELKISDNEEFKEIAYYGTYANSDISIQGILTKKDAAYQNQTAISWAIYK